MADNKDNQDSNDEASQQELAANLIRQRIGSLYEVDEPSAKTELQDAKDSSHRSKHQQFMYELSNSGRSLAEIQTAWHEYYTNLSDIEKHQVWQEFYDLHAKTSHYARHTQHSPIKSRPSTDHGNLVGEIAWPAKAAARSVADIKQRLLSTVSAHGKLKAKHHFKSLAFGLGMGGVVILLLLFSFFNERFIAPFLSPSRIVSSTPIIIDPSSAAVGPESKIIIPKINVEVPVVYDQASIEEKAIQKSLENGVVHYAASPSPGEQGNAVIVGHSSNNILNQGKYKFAFVLLSRLNVGDTFMVQKDSKRYVYTIYDKRIVDPNDLSVLDKADRVATVTLITCDPPGTSLKRLVVIGEQITPDPSKNLASNVQPPSEKPKILPSNAPSLWQRITDWFAS